AVPFRRRHSTSPAITSIAPAATPAVATATDPPRIPLAYPARHAGLADRRELRGGKRKAEGSEDSHAQKLSSVAARSASQPTPRTIPTTSIQSRPRCRRHRPSRPRATHTPATDVAANVTDRIIRKWKYSGLR